MKKTITSIFMVPTLGIPKGQLIDLGFQNAYSKDGHREVQYENCIYIVLIPKNIQKFQTFVASEFKRTPSIIDHYEYPGGYHVLVYKLSDKYDWDFDMVRKGKYSKTTLAFQKLFSPTVKVMVNFCEREEVSLQYRVFNKTKDLVQYWEDMLDVKFDKDQEIWHWYDEIFETLNLERITALQ